MAVKTYRFRGVTDADLVQLSNEAGSSVTVDDKTGGKVVDLNIEESFADDLKDSMASRGWEFISEDPSGPPSDNFVPQGSVPVPAQVGQFLYSPDGVAFIQQVPVVTEDGIIVVTEPEGFIVTTE